MESKIPSGHTGGNSCNRREEIPLENRKEEQKQEEMRKEPMTEEELLAKQRELEEKEAALQQKESKLQKIEDKITNAKHGIYDRIDVSVATMDKIIAVVGGLLIIAVFAGIFL